MVDRHQADDVGRFGERGGERLLRRLGDELGKLRDELVEVAAVLVGGAGLFDELVQVGELALAEEFGEQTAS